MTKRDAMRPILSTTMLVSLFAVFSAATTPAASAEQGPTVNHSLAVTLDPAHHYLKVRDRIRIPGAFVTTPFTISLNADLNLQTVSGLKLLPLGSRVAGTDAGIDRDDHDPGSRVPVNIYSVEGAVPGQELTGELSYEGVIDYTVQQSGSEYARAFSESP